MPKIKEYPFVYASWRDVPLREFKKRWPNFSPREMACRGTGKVAFNFEAMDKLQALRKLRGRPIIINSAYRSPEHNASLKGAASKSKHLLAQAFDARQENHNPHNYLRDAKAVGFKGFGTYPASNFIHVDVGPARSWGDPFPKSTAAELPIEVKVQPEPAKQSDPVPTPAPRSRSGFAWLLDILLGGRK